MHSQKTFRMSMDIGYHLLSVEPFARLLSTPLKKKVGKYHSVVRDGRAGKGEKYGEIEKEGRAGKESEERGVGHRPPYLPDEMRKRKHLHFRSSWHLSGRISAQSVASEGATWSYHCKLSYCFFTT